MDLWHFTRNKISPTTALQPLIQLCHHYQTPRAPCHQYPKHPEPFPFKSYAMDKYFRNILCVQFSSKIQFWLLTDSLIKGTTISDADAESQAICPGNSCTFLTTWVWPVWAAVPHTPRPNFIWVHATLMNMCWHNSNFKVIIGFDAMCVFFWLLPFLETVPSAKGFHCLWLSNKTLSNWLACLWIHSGNSAHGVSRKMH